MSNPASVLSAIGDASSIVIIMHRFPDGDSVGSGLALGMALCTLGRQVRWVARDPVPSRLRFLPESHAVKTWEEFLVEAFQPEVAISVDCGSPARLSAPEAFWKSGVPLINIDHHEGNPGFGACNWVDAKVSSTGEMVARLFKEAKWPLGPSQGLCLYVAMSTDTLSFRQSNTGRATIDLLSWVVRMSHLDLAAANRALWEGQSLQDVKFLGWALSSIEVTATGRVAWIVVPRAVMTQYGVDDAMVDTVVHHLVSIAQVEVGFVVRELQEPGWVKISWRGKQAWNVAHFAEAFGGGGHRYAAAAQLEMTPEQAVGKVLEGLTEVSHG